MATTVTSLLKYAGASRPGDLQYWEWSTNTATTNRTATDIVQMFDLPAGTLILGMGIHTQTGEGATATVDIGLAGSTEFFSSSSIETAGYSVISTAMPYLLAAADTIDLTFDHNCDAAKIRVWMVTMPVAERDSSD